MKKNLALAATVALMCAFLWQGRVYSQAAPAHFSVKDYGVKGDGKTDDTEALQKAIEMAVKLRVPEIMLPPGDYRISKPIIPKVSVRGPATFWQTNPEEDFFYSEWAHQISFSDLAFRGGRTALNLANPNIDTGFIRITNCKFFKTNGPAINIREGSNSTFTIIRDCQFINCDQVLITHTDVTTMKDCWISGGADQNNEAMIENRGANMILEDIIGVDNANGIDQRWIDNHGGGSLICRDFMFGAHSGGFTPIVNFAKYDTRIGAAQIILEDCQLFGRGNLKRQCAVYCEEIPNVIEMRNCNLLGLPPIMISEKIDLNNYFKNVDPKLLKFSAVDSIGVRSDEMPELLKNPVIVVEEKERPFQLSEEDTQKLLADAVKAQLARPHAEEPPGEFQGHKQKTDASEHIELTFDKYKWKITNPECGAIAPSGDDVIVMRRIDARHFDYAPQVWIRNVVIDLDTYPYLAYKQKDPGPEPKKAGFAYGVWVVDREAGVKLQVAWISSNDFNYRAFNLKKALAKGGIKGTRTLDILYYHFASHYYAPPTKEDPGVIFTEPGGYSVIDFIRVEAE